MANTPEYQKQYYLDNKKKVLERNRQYYLKNKEKKAAKLAETKVNCKSCGILFGIRIRNQKFCSRKCMGSYFSGTCSSNRYPNFYRPNHPNADKHGHIKSHRFVMAEKLGRPLRNDEIVHHKNGNVRDFRIDNLEIMSRKEHCKHHNMLNEKCTIKSCNKPHKAKGLCPAHYRRLRFGQNLNNPIRKWNKL